MLFKREQERWISKTQRSCYLRHMYVSREKLLRSNGLSEPKKWCKKAWIDYTIKKQNIERKKKEK